MLELESHYAKVGVYLFYSLNWLVVGICDETNDWMILAINLKTFSLEIIYQHK
jgi:hypothetical protein